MIKRKTSFSLQTAAPAPHRRCPIGFVRSVKVILQCGLRDATLAVGEPETCTYVLDVVALAACVDI